MSAVNLGLDIESETLLKNSGELSIPDVQRAIKLKQDDFDDTKVVPHREGLNPSAGLVLGVDLLLKMGNGLKERKMQMLRSEANTANTKKVLIQKGKTNQVEYPIDMENLSWHGLEILEVEPCRAQPCRSCFYPLDKNNPRKNSLDDMLSPLADFLVQKPDWKNLLFFMHTICPCIYGNEYVYDKKDLVRKVVSAAMDDFVRSCSAVHRELNLIKGEKMRVEPWNVGATLWQKILSEDTKIDESDSIEKVADSFIASNDMPEACKLVPSSYKNAVIRGILLRNLISAKESLHIDILRYIAAVAYKPIAVTNVEGEKMKSISFFPVSEANYKLKRINFRVDSNGEIGPGIGITGYGYESKHLAFSDYTNDMHRAFHIVHSDGCWSEPENGLDGVSNRDTFHDICRNFEKN